MFCFCKNINASPPRWYLLKIAVECTVGWEFLFVQLVKTLEVFIREKFLGFFNSICLKKLWKWRSKCQKFCDGKKSKSVITNTSLGVVFFLNVAELGILYICFCTPMCGIMAMVILNVWICLSSWERTWISSDGDIRFDTCTGIWEPTALKNNWPLID